MRPISKSSIGVLIADDSAAFCRLIATMLQSESSTHIVAIAGNLDDALHFGVEYTPDVLLLDLHLDDLAGHDPLSVKIAFLSCVRNIIAMSTRTDEEERQFAQLYGASRLVDKFFLSEQLIPTIRRCAQPKRPLSATPPRRQRQAPTRWAS
jgi:DNA-binding response OmpR family regulator